MRYSLLKQLFYLQEAMKGEHLEGFVCFTEDSYPEPYSEEARTYLFTSRNQAFMPLESGDGSIIGSALDGTDKNVSLDLYMADEHGMEGQWKIERCGLVKYLVIKTIERDSRCMGPFSSQEAAEKVMLEDFSVASGIPVECAEARYRGMSQDSLEDEDAGFGFYENAAWFNGTENLDWKVVRLLIE